MTNKILSLPSFTLAAKGSHLEAKCLKSAFPQSPMALVELVELVELEICFFSLSVYLRFN